MQRVHDTRQLSKWILFWLSVLKSIHVVAALLFIAGGMTEYSGSYLIGVSVCAAFFWIAYFLQRMQIVSGSHSVHVTAFLCFSLFAFVGLFNPYEFDQIWVLFLIYPVAVSLFHQKEVFFIWGTLSYVVYGLLVSVDPTVTDAVDLLNRCTLGVASMILAGIVFATLTHVKNSYRQATAERNREAVFAMLQMLIPVVIRKSQTSSREIEQMSRLMKRMMMEFPEEKIDDWEIRMISLLHYVSRIKWPDYLFEKEEKLTGHEYQIIQEHCFIGGDLFKEEPEFERVVKALMYHHERYDGTGYPRQLEGENIPLVAQILGIVESFIAMTTPRSYRKALSPEEACEEIRSMAGSVYDERVVEALLKVLNISSPLQTVQNAPPLVG